MTIFVTLTEVNHDYIQFMDSNGWYSSFSLKMIQKDEIQKLQSFLHKGSTIKITVEANE